MKEKVDSVCGHDSLSFSKKEKVDSYVEVAISKETKSADEKARSNVGVGVIKCNKSGSERAGAPFQVLDVQEVNDCGPSSLKECSPLIGCLEKGALSGKGEVGALNIQSALMKPLKKNSRVQDGSHEELVVVLDSKQTSFVIRVKDSLGTRPPLYELEQSGTRVAGDGVDGCSITLVKDLPKSPVVQGLIDIGPAAPEKLDEEEEARRSEVSKSRECGRAFPPGGLFEGLGAGLEGEVEGEGNNVATKGSSSGLDGEVEGRQSLVDQVFLVHQKGSSSNSLFTSDSAIENCNRIFWVNTDKNMAASVWGVGKEVGFSFSDREDVVLNGIYSLSNQGGVTTRRMWKKRSKFVNEDF